MEVTIDCIRERDYKERYKVYFHINYERVCTEALYKKSEVMKAFNISGEEFNSLLK